MESLSFIEVLLIALIPAFFSSLITYLINSHEIKRYKADSMAERSARHFLNHATFTDRSFKTLKKYLGGWDKDQDELRRILVRAGAVRVFRNEGKSNEEEWWYLLERAAERIENKENNK